MIADTLDVIRRDLLLGDEDLLVLQPAAADAPGAPPLGAADEIREVGRTRPLLVVFPGRPDDKHFARLRDALWPDVHFVSLYDVDEAGGIERRMAGRSEALEGRVQGGRRTIVHTRTYDEALGPATTKLKFDLQAQSWNGAPGSPTYAHYRWMRRLIAVVAAPQMGERTLDAGCGTGWVGIEAARKGAMVSAFDASTEMVAIAGRNADEVDVDLDARPGFVEDVPFDRAFDLVLNSGVISFAPDPDVYLDRLDALVAPGGRLCIGDINPESRGFARRRARFPLIPARELNGLTRRTVEEKLVARGYTLQRALYYQLSFPVPELMALSEKKLGGFGCGLMLSLNKAACSLDQRTGSRGRRWFDSWIILARKGAAPGGSSDGDASHGGPTDSGAET